MTPSNSATDSAIGAAGPADAILASIGDAIITTDTEFRVTHLNPSGERLTGWSVAEAVGQALDTVLVLVSDATRSPIPSIAARCLSEGRPVDLESGVSLRRRDGSEIPIGDSTSPILADAGEITGVVLVLRDETENRRVGRRLSYEATHDLLTGLINRREFERRLARVVSGLSAGSDENVLLFLDLDQFKSVNDTCGHAAGDELLKLLGPLLRGRLRKRDTLARLGGDEFSILLEGCPLEQAQQIAENIRSEVEQLGFTYDGHSFRISASIGLLVLTGQEWIAAEALSTVDAACYAAKSAGGNRVELALQGTDAS